MFKVTHDVIIVHLLALLHLSTAKQAVTLAITMPVKKFSTPEKYRYQNGFGSYHE